MKEMVTNIEKRFLGEIAAAVLTRLDPRLETEHSAYMFSQNLRHERVESGDVDCGKKLVREGADVIGLTFVA